MHSYVHCGIICNSQDTEATQVPINRQADKKQWYLHTMEYYLAKKRMKSYVTAWAYLEGSMLSEISQRKTNTI